RRVPSAVSCQQDSNNSPELRSSVIICLIAYCVERCDSTSTVWPWSPTTIPAPDRPTTGEEMSSALAPPTTVESPGIRRLRQEVRDVLSAEISAGTLTPWSNTWLTRWDEGFTRRLAERGWIGMTITVEYGGQVPTHWVSYSQRAPSLLRYGTYEQKQEFLRLTAAGDDCFAIGKMEPVSRWDLAIIRTKGVRAAGGWTVTGNKTWTSRVQFDWAYDA